MVLIKSVLRILLLIFSFCFLACSIACVVIGAIYALKLGLFRSIKEFESEFRSNFICYGLIALGLCMFVVAVIGFITIAAGNIFWTIVYPAFLTAVLVLSIVLCVHIFQTHNKVIKGDVRNRLEEIWQQTKKADQENKVKKINESLMDFIQGTFKCCGIEGRDDYEKNPSWGYGNGTLPWSCCPKDPIKCKKPNAYKIVIGFEVLAWITSIAYLCMQF
ncbi:CD63 antigen-like [Hermetia illucens]|uniref:CD63 antigen-like n=1 Tax=Hermetia illucens TaxID=343691 RepID=UPI0018CBFA3E|nr:CD63 antigen-like [Hermetia illucens]